MPSSRPASLPRRGGNDRVKWGMCGGVGIRRSRKQKQKLQEGVVIQPTSLNKRQPDGARTAVLGGRGEEESNISR